MMFYEEATLYGAYPLFLVEARRLLQDPGQAVYYN